MIDNIIEIKNISKIYKTRTENNLIKAIFDPKLKFNKAVDNISFSIKPGECVAFLGPNGAGKTTTTKMMTGLIYPTEGVVQVLGYKPQDRDKNFLNRIGLVMGNKSGMAWDLTVNNSMELSSVIYGLPLINLNNIDNPISDYEKYISELVLSLFPTNLERLWNTQVRKLSLGERMKFELINSILHKPDVLFLDEPTIGLDITSKKNIRQFIRKLNIETKTTIILTSHDMDDIENICDRVIVITSGKISYDGSISDLKNNNEKKLEDIIEKIFNEQ